MFNNKIWSTIGNMWWLKLVAWKYEKENESFLVLLLKNGQWIWKIILKN
jgi:hypothetical protein